MEAPQTNDVQKIVEAEKTLTQIIEDRMKHNQAQLDYENERLVKISNCKATGHLWEDLTDTEKRNHKMCKNCGIQIFE